MDNEKELQAIFRELSRENQAYLLLEARRARNVETTEQERGRSQWRQTRVPAVKTH